MKTRMIHWFLVAGKHWHGVISEAGETAAESLERHRKNTTSLVISTPAGCAPFEWDSALRREAVLKPHLAHPVRS